jgi:hypothetical protein
MKQVQSALALRRFSLRTFALTNFYNEAHTLRLARHPKSSEQNRTFANENVNKGRNVAQSVSETRGSIRVSSPVSHCLQDVYLLIFSHFYSMCYYLICFS